jgi:hypothetical protein
MTSCNVLIAIWRSSSVASGTLINLFPTPATREMGALMMPVTKPVTAPSLAAFPAVFASATISSARSK